MLRERGHPVAADHLDSALGPAQALADKIGEWFALDGEERAARRGEFGAWLTQWRADAAEEP